MPDPLPDEEEMPYEEDDVLITKIIDAKGKDPFTVHGLALSETGDDPSRYIIYSGPTLSTLPLTSLDWEVMYEAKSGDRCVQVFYEDREDAKFLDRDLDAFLTYAQDYAPGEEPRRIRRDIGIPETRLIEDGEFDSATLLELIGDISESS